MSEVTIRLTEEQQKQIKNSTGNDMTELHLSFESKGALTNSELNAVSGGSFRITSIRTNASGITSGGSVPGSITG